MCARAAFDQQRSQQLIRRSRARIAWSAGGVAAPAIDATVALGRRQQTGFGDTPTARRAARLLLIAPDASNFVAFRPMCACLHFACEDARKAEGASGRVSGLGLGCRGTCEFVL